jgi:hypothetical protein
MIDASHSPREEKVFEMYSKLGLGHNSTCYECARSVAGGRISMPISIWHVGALFGRNDGRISFCRKDGKG